MSKTLRNRMENLLSVKSLVTLTLTAVFAYMAAAGKVSQDFMTVYTVVIAFYFGTQSRKGQDAPQAVEAFAAGSGGGGAEPSGPRGGGGGNGNG